MLWEGGTLSLQRGDGEWLTVPPSELAGPIEPGLFMNLRIEGRVGG